MKLIWLFIAIGGVVGGYIPVLFGQNELSLWSILGTITGSLFAIWLYRRTDIE